MRPLCLASIALSAAGVASAGGLVAFLALSDAISAARSA
ncbi:MAG: hypothetical protein JWM78_643 [Verrucomicrobiaceae bacterium]|nr:hypothetical protein [Verrucomicrobiaceae bacterium]